MAKVVTPITATVEFITGIKQGNYGEYRSVLFKDAMGEKIWKSFNPEAEELALLRKGAKVQLIPAGTSKNGNEKHNIVLLQDSSGNSMSGGTVSEPLYPSRSYLHPSVLKQSLLPGKRMRNKSFRQSSVITLIYLNSATRL